MQTVRDEIKQAILSNDPVNITFKDNKNSLIVFAPQYSYHSAVLDKAFRIAEANGVKFKCNKIHPYSVKFY